jgi:23S rRNA (uracil1939-C5)-methyltransferase
VLRESSQRVTPRCRYFGDLRRLRDAARRACAQVAAKQRVLEDNLARIGKVTRSMMLPPVSGPRGATATRARLSCTTWRRRAACWWASTSGARASSPTHLVRGAAAAGRAADPGAARDVHGDEAARPLPQIELAVGEDVTVFVLRNLEPIPEEDAAKLRAFADAHGIQWWLQPKGPDTAHPCYPLEAPALDYALPEFGLRIAFGPTEFTQVNAGVNRVLVRRAVDMLDPRPGERVGDLFCGLGNFSLPLATRGATVLGMEGAPSLVSARRRTRAPTGSRRARRSWPRPLQGRRRRARALGPVDKLLIDPPRDGAMDICKALPDRGPHRIVYVSCSPSTLARDRGVLVNVKGTASRPRAW